MAAELPVYETVEDALKWAVMALGGAKVVGPTLWPDKAPDAAARSLLDCLNANREARLSFSQMIMIMRKARDIGCYTPFQWCANECGFDANPITRQEEDDRATSALVDATKAVMSALATIERMQQRTTGPLKAVM